MKTHINSLDSLDVMTFQVISGVDRGYFDLPMPGKDWTIGAQQQVSLETPNPPVRQLNGIVADWSGKLDAWRRIQSF